jgi:hypothetical protein
LNVELVLHLSSFRPSAAPRLEPNEINQTNEINEINETNEINEINQPNEINEINQINETNQINEINETNETNQYVKFQGLTLSLRRFWLI